MADARQRAIEDSSERLRFEKGVIRQSALERAIARVPKGQVLAE